MHLFTTVKITKYLPYRTARGRGMLVEVPYHPGDTVHKFEQDLCREAKVPEDNHHGFLVENSEGKSLFLWFRDWSLMVCTDFNEKSY